MNDRKIRLALDFPDSNMNKINVGCGPSRREGWINVDIQPFKTVDVRMDVTKEWDFKDVSFIYAEHFIEHLTLNQGFHFLYNAGKSLSDGGWIRLSTPNVEWVLKTHYKFDKLSDTAAALDSVTAINRAFYGWGHRFIYSPFMLKELLSQIGFSDIRLTDYQQSTILEFMGIEEHGGFSSFQGSSSIIIIEAQRKGPVKLPDEFHKILTEKFIKYNEANH